MPEFILYHKKKGSTPGCHWIRHEIEAENAQDAMRAAILADWKWLQEKPHRIEFGDRDQYHVFYEGEGEGPKSALVKGCHWFSETMRVATRDDCQKCAGTGTNYVVSAPCSPCKGTGKIKKKGVAFRGEGE